MTDEPFVTTVAVLTSVIMCAGAGTLWMWSDRSGKAAWLIGGLWMVVVLAGIVLGWPWNLGVASASALAALLLYTLCDFFDWRR